VGVFELACDVTADLRSDPCDARLWGRHADDSLIYETACACSDTGRHTDMSVYETARPDMSVHVQTRADDTKNCQSMRRHGFENCSHMP
jgi:hypothetical protein